MLQEIQSIIEEILDIDGNTVTPETYVIRDLDAESIDLLELAVALNSNFDVKIIDEDIFLRSLRIYVTEARENGEDVIKFLLGRYPFITEERAAEILDDMENSPVLKVKDLISYIEWRKSF